MTSLLEEPLQLEKILVNILAGSPEVFAFISMIVISFACARFNVPNKIFMPLIFLFVIMFASTIGLGFYLLGVLIAGLTTFYSISRLMKR